MSRENLGSEMFFTLKEFAERLDRHARNEVGGEKGAGSCVNILIKNGVLKRIHMSDRLARIQLGNPPGQPLPRGRQGVVLQRLQARLEGVEHKELSINLGELCTNLNIDRTQLLTSLRALRDKGYLAVYEPPEKSSGVILLKPEAPLNLGKVVEGEIEMERAAEYSKLEHMVKYTDADCRRRYIIDYFGEVAPFRRCGTCDVCQRIRRAKSKQGRSP
jgi:hypothetical protein